MTPEEDTDFDRWATEEPVIPIRQIREPERYSIWAGFAVWISVFGFGFLCLVGLVTIIKALL